MEGEALPISRTPTAQPSLSNQPLCPTDVQSARKSRKLTVADAMCISRRWNMARLAHALRQLFDNAVKLKIAVASPLTLRTTVIAAIRKKFVTGYQ
jgi:hypothetical protein